MRPPMIGERHSAARPRQARPSAWFENGFAGVSARSLPCCAKSPTRPSRSVQREAHRSPCIGWPACWKTWNALRTAHPKPLGSLSRRPGASRPPQGSFVCACPLKRVNQVNLLDDRHPGFTRRSLGNELAHVESVSRASRARLRSTPQRYPEMEPSFLTTRWQGMATARRLAAQAPATARTALASPSRSASSV